MLFVLIACDGGMDSIVLIDSGTTTDTFCADTADDLSEGFEDSLEPDGCRWRVSAVNSEGTVALNLDAVAFAEASVGESVDMSYTLPDDDVSLEVLVGCGFSDTCEGDGSASRTYEATAGTVNITAVPDGDGSTAQVELLAITLDDEWGDSGDIEQLAFEVQLYAAP